MSLIPAPDGGYPNGNTAEGTGSLDSLSTGLNNTALGELSLNKLEGGRDNTAVGRQSLGNLVSGQDNVGIGRDSIQQLQDGSENTAIGGSNLLNAVNNVLGNIAIGFGAGRNISGNFNIDIGNEGISGESNTIRIGNSVRHSKTFIAGIFGIAVEGTPVVIKSDGQMGTMQIIPIGTILRIASGTPAPIGFTLIGTETFHYNDLTGHPTVLTVNLYQKN